MGLAVLKRDGGLILSGLGWQDHSTIEVTFGGASVVTEGTYVQLANLTKAPELNGLKGHVVKFADNKVTIRMDEDCPMPDGQLKCRLPKQNVDILQSANEAGAWASVETLVAILMDKSKDNGKERGKEEIEEYVSGRGGGPFNQEQIDEAWAGLQA